jgi:uncharacterized membrane protein YczE
MFQRVLLLVVGTCLGAYGYLLTTAAGVGNGPLFAVQDGLRHQLGISLGRSALVVGLAVVAIALLLKGPLGIGTVCIPIANGLWISLLEHSVPTVRGVAAQWVEFLGGTAVMMFGVVLALSACFGASAMDGVMLGLARRFHTSPGRARLGMEVTLACLGAALGGRIGLGTVVMGATVGPLFQMCSRVLGALGLAAGPAVGTAVGSALAHETVATNG